MVDDSKTRANGSCCKELLLGLHTILRLTDCIGLTFDPRTKLDLTNRSITGLRDKIKRLTSVDPFRKDLLLEQSINVANEQAQNLLITCDELKTNSSILFDHAKGNMSKLHGNQEEIESILHKLRGYSKSSSSSSSSYDDSNVDPKFIFDNSRNLLKRIKSVNISMLSALHELRAAQSLRSKFLNLIGSSSATNISLEMLTRIGEYQKRFDDVRHVSLNASLVSVETSRLNERLKLMLSDLKHSEADVHDLQREVEECVDEKHSIYATFKLVSGLRTLAYDQQIMDDLTSLLQMLGNKFKKWSKEKENLKPSLLRALEKYEKLSDKVSALDKVNFDLPLSTLAQKNEGLQKLRSRLANLMNETLNKTYLVVHVASWLNESINAYLEVQNFTSLENIIIRADEIVLKFRNISSIVNFLNTTSGGTVENVISVLENIANNSSASNTSLLLEKVVNDIKSVNRSTARCEERLLSISSNSSAIGASVTGQADELKLIGRELNITVRSLGAKVDELTSGISVVSERVERLNEYERELAREVATLKDTLKYARARAANVRVPICHKGGCIRSYPLTGRSSLSNSIEFSFRTNSVDFNQLLVIINNLQSSEFIAVELVNGKIRFSWKIGDETNTMETLDEIPFHDELTWYKVKAKRIGHVGKLMVRDVNNVDESNTVTRRFHPSPTPFDYQSTTEFFVGGAPQDYELPVDLSSRDFYGCIGDVALDDTPVGMFDFGKLLSSSSQTCYGSPLVSKTDDAADRGAFQFDGSGHAVARSFDELSLESIAVSLSFKSFWGNSLLFGSVNNSTGEFIALELKDGRLAFKYGWPIHGVHTTLKSKHVYNTNRWVKVYARRTNLQGVLRVENEDIKSPVHDSPIYDSLNLSGSSTYFGGVPSHVVHEELSSSTNFLGCMKDVVINSVASHVVDLFDGRHVGMKPGCSANRALLSGFPGPSSSSFLELEFHHESSPATFSFIFKSSSPDALLLLSIDEDYRLSFLVRLSSKGGLEVLSRWNEKLSKFEHRRSLCDDASHLVSAHEHQDGLKVMVDRILLKESRADDSDESDGFHFSRSDVLFVGGVPPDVLEPRSEGTFEPFRGCVSELIVDNVLLTFENPKSFKNVDIGRCQMQKNDDLFQPSSLEPSYSPPSQPRSTASTSRVVKNTSVLARSSIENTTPSVNNFDEVANVLPLDSKSQHCSFKKAYHYEPRAVSFGASRASHVLLDLREYTDINRFTISFYLRTHHEEGSLLHSSSRDSFSWSVSLMLGHLAVVENHRGEEKQTETKERYNTGRWVRLDVLLRNEFIKIVVDKNEEIKFNVNSSGFENLYVGRRPPESHYDFDASVFRGCLANFSINSELIHLANSPNMIGLQPCHSNIEKGAFFDGYAYALFAEHFHFKSLLTISFNVKLYQPNGVLFAMSDFHKFATLVILLNDEQMSFKVSDYDSMYSVESEYCPDCLCDGSWHQVVAELFSDSITLRIDGQTSTGTKLGSTIDLELEGRLYIGGNPAPIGPLIMPESGDFFSGCLANVRVNDEPIDWWNAEELFGVHLSGCPILS